MKFITSKQNDGTEVKLFYHDIGQGKPVVFIHGWPVNSMMWEYQLAELPKYGLRCIAYDRRGFGKSDQPFNGYDYDTLTDDLKALLDELDLNDVTLVGFSMAGGEVVRYCSKYESARVSKIVLVSSVVPYMLLTEDNPDGIPPEMVQQITDGLNQDHPGFLMEFFKQFFGVSLLSHPVSQGILDSSLMLAMQALLKGTIDCVHSFAETDFREEIKHISTPALIIHGDADQTVPIKVTSDETAKLLPNAQYIVYEGEPHGLYYTSKDRLNKDLVQFINRIGSLETL
ncbi:Non-heme chloroperoxidase [Arcticibacter svalbardensis MN12-7]|uniref:Non-heme chloroperoxidase n=1 Tax=Arcticibacter svalbardensis MN12-7 TaxID=1150600 RepID=R9H2P8_9SPHI|nr:alpha/beta hydrolase [Arcticibacter svalbardensis]EOR95489.1 Non-heme chloroperoxidase [Arcticibacter svalbardensis MN12-7]